MKQKETNNETKNDTTNEFERKDDSRKENDSTENIPVNVIEKIIEEKIKTVISKTADKKKDKQTNDTQKSNIDDLEEVKKLRQELARERVNIKIEQDINNVVSKVSVIDHEVLIKLLKDCVEPDYENNSYKIKYNGRTYDENGKDLTFNKLIEIIKKQKPYLFKTNNNSKTETHYSDKKGKLSPIEAYKIAREIIQGRR